MATLRDLVVGITFEDNASRQINRVNDSLDDTSSNARNAGDGVSEARTQLANFGKVGLVAVAGVSGALVGAGTAVLGVVAATSELNRDLAILKANASDNGFGMENMEEQLGKIVGVTGETDSAVETLSNLMQTGFKDSQMSDVIDEINGAAIRFSDTLKTEGIADGIQETFATGEAIGMFGELLERSGVDLDVFNAGLADAKKNGTEADYVLKQMQDLDLSSAYDEYLKLNPEVTKNAEATHNFQMTMAELGKTLAPIATGITNLVSSFAEWLMSNETVKGAIDGISNALSNTEGIMSTFNSAIGWIKDNGQYIVAAIAGIVGGLAAFHILTTINSAFKIMNALMIAYRTGTILSTLAAWGFNTALLANPLTWVAIAIGAVIAIGVLLYKNWDTVTEKAKVMWVAVKTVFGMFYDWGRDKIGGVTSFFSDLISKVKDFISRITNFKMPKWVTSVGSAISGAASKIGGIVKGSHATGLATVPTNGYIAELHAGESVLTAQQSNALRNAGMLSANADGTPNLNLSPSNSGGSRSGGAGSVFNITINAASGNPIDIKEAVKQGINEVMDSFSRNNPQVTLR